MLSAASKVVDLHGSRHIADLTTMFEKHISTNTDGSEASDYVKEAVVYSSGSHCTAHGNWRCTYSECRFTTYRSSQDSFGTSSGRLSQSVLHHLSRLSKEMSIGWWTISSCNSSRDRSMASAEERLTVWQESSRARESRPSPISTFLNDSRPLWRTRSVMRLVKAPCSRSKHSRPRWKRNFEPYIIELLPSLLASFGDASADVREATEDAAKVIMGNMSG